MMMLPLKAKKTPIYTIKKNYTQPSQNAISKSRSEILPGDL